MRIRTCKNCKYGSIFRKIKNVQTTGVCKRGEEDVLILPNEKCEHWKGQRR